MSLDYLNEAFKRLDAIVLNEEAFNTSYTGINDLASFMQEDDDTDMIKVIDPNTQDPETLKDSYVGKVITNCNVCHSNIFTAKEDIIIDDEGTVNPEAQCPYCGEFSGFTILGEISPYKANAEEESAPQVEVDGEPVQETSKDNGEALEESLDMCDPNTLESYLNDVEDGEGWVTLDKAVSDTEILGCPKTADEIKEFVSNYKRAYMLTFGGIDVIFTPTAPSYDTVGKELGISESDLHEDFPTTPTTRKWKPHTLRLLHMIGSDLVNGMDESLTEAMNNVNVETDDTIVTVNSDENGKVTVSTEPKEEGEIIPEGSEEGDMITPISDETLNEIETNNSEEETSTEEEPEEQTLEGEEEVISEEEADLDFEEIDEEGLDELGESYFRQVYGNVNSFKTTAVSSSPSKLIVEGLITFNSKVSKKTGFVFSPDCATPDGKIKFLGENLQLSRGKKAFGLVGCIKNKKFLPESFIYDYRTKNVKDNAERVSGVITRK